jgi:hypothetical protein
MIQWDHRFRKDVIVPTRQEKKRCIHFFIEALEKGKMKNGIRNGREDQGVRDENEEME